MKSSRFLTACLVLVSFVAPIFATPAVTTTTMTDGVTAGTRTVKQGDTITYTTTLTNNSGGTLTNVVLSDPTPANTTLVPGSVHASPIANNDSYTLIGNTKLYVGTTAPVGEPAVTSATGLLANDTVITDSVTAAINSSPAHGTVLLNTDGTFTYTPAVGYSGSDSFAYTLTNTVDNTLSDTAIVSLTITPAVWYVDNSKTSGTGASTSPLNSLTALAAVNNNAGPAASDIIFLYKGSSTYSGGITLKASQRLVGQGVDLVVSTVTLVAAGSGNTPTVGGTVTLANSTSLAGFNISSGAATGLAGSSVTGVTVSLPSITATTGSAISLASVGGTFSFTSVSSTASGTAPGISLNGLTGSFTVSGSGTAGSGGTIANKTGSDGSTSSGIGIYLNNAQSVSLSRMQLNDFGNYAILGTSVSGFSLAYSTISGTNGSNSTNYPEDAVSFTNLTGSATIDNCSIGGGCVDNLRVVNTAGTLNRIYITNTSFGLNGTATGNDSVSLSASGTATLNATIIGCTFAGARGDIVDCTGQAGTTMDVVVTNNGMTNTHSAILSGGGGVIVQSAGTTNFNIAGNTLGNARGRAIVVAKAALTGTLGTITGTISSNTIGTFGTSLSGSSESSGIYVDAGGAGKLTVAITNNIIHQTNEAGIYLTANNQTVAGNNGTFNATVTGNTVDTPGVSNFAAFFADIGTGVNSEASSAYLDISGNTFTGTNTAYLGAFDLSAASAIAVRLPGYTGASTDTTAVATYVTGRNPASTATSHITVASGGTYAGGAAFLTLAPVTETRTLNAELRAPNVAVAAPNPEPGTPHPELSAPALTADTLRQAVAHARNLWSDTGLTPAQTALLDSLHFELGGLTDRHLGSADGAHVTIDRSTRWSVASTVPAQQLDLLTAILHEMGHTLGLDDTYAVADRANIMYGYLAPGERRLPVVGQAAGVQPNPHGHVHFITATLNIGNVPNGKTVTVKRQVTVGAVSVASPQITAQDTWTGTNLSALTTNDPDVAGTGNATVTLIAIPPAVTANPGDTTVAPSATATFTASASGAEAPTVQWQVSTDNGTHYNNVAGATNATLSFTAVANQSGSLFRAVFTNSTGSATTTAATLTVAAPPGLTLGFSPASIPLNGSTTLTYTLSNSNSFALTGVAVSNTLPSGLVVATPNGLSGPASGTVTATAGASSVSLTGATIAGGGSLTFSVNVTGTSAGSKSNSATPGAAESGAGTAATAGLAVVAPPTISAAFSPATVAFNGTTTLTFTLTNPNGSALTGVAFSSTLPSGLAVAATPNATDGTGGTFTATAGATGVSLASGTIPANSSKTVSVDLTPSSVGVKSNTTGAISSTEGGTGATSNAAGLTVSAPTITVAPTTLNAVAVGTATSQTVSATGGTAAYSFAVTAGALPPGLSLGTDGALTGTATGGGIYNFTVTATDSTPGTGSPFTGSRAYALTVNAPTITLSPTTLTAATVGTDTNQTVTASGGTAGYTYAVTAGALPAGLSLSGAGALTGTPTAGGTFNFTVTATDSSTGTGPFTGSRAYSLTVNAPTITLAPTTLSAIAAGASTSQSVTASGGTATYTYAVTAGALPAGLSLATDGTLSGTATAAGAFNFTVTATDSSTGTGPYTGSGVYTLTVSAPTIAVSPTTLAAAAIGTTTSQTLTASGGTATYTYAVTAGALPAGLSLATDGTLSGTATAAGAFNFTVTATDSTTGTGAPFTGSRAYALTVNAPTITLAPTTLTAATVATATSQTITASGGTATYTYAVTAGALPAGLSLATDGTLSGTPAAGGTFNFTVTATDSSTGTGPFTGSRAYALTVSAPTITLAPTTLTAATVATATGQTITASGGTATYTFAVTAGALPAGLSLATDGTLSGTPTAGGSFNFTVTATDSSTGSGPFTGSRAYALTVNPPTISLSPSTALPDSSVNANYSHTVIAIDGTAPYTFAVTAGALPPGLSLDPSGLVSGTPTASGSYTFTLTATDSSTGTGPYTGTRSYSIIISTVPTVTSPTSADVTGNSATLGGEVSSDGSSAVTARGIVLSVTSVNAEPRLGGTGVVDVPATGTTGVFTVPAGGLALGTTYSYAAYATNAVGTSYSATGTFTTGPSASLVDTTQDDFAAGAGIGVDTTTNPGDVILGGVQADQSNTAGTTTGTGFTTASWGGQTFTPALSGLLMKVDVQLFANGTGSPGTDLLVSVRATSGGLPTGSDLATATIPAFTDNNAATYTATFASPATLTAGQQYALILRPVSTPTLSYFWIRSSPSTYDGGSRVIGTSSGTSWAADTTRDFNFTTYVSSAALSGDFISSLKDSGLASGTHWTTLSWTATTPEGTGVKFQVAGGDNIDGQFTFVGPDGTPDTYFTESGASLAQFYGHRYLQYRAYLTTNDLAVTPALHDVTLGYDLVAPPTVTSTAAADVTGISATLGGDVTFDGGGIISARGIVFSATADNANPTLDGQGVTVLPAATNGTGAYTVSATGLTRGTGYSYVAYATNQGGTTYSSVATFTTVAIPVITSDPLTASATYGTTFGGYTVAASSSPTSYAADGLPAGLSINPDTGVISGKPSVAGSFNVALSATNVAGTGTATLAITVAKAQLTVTADAKSKVYGAANPAATATITGFVNGETLATSDVAGTPALVVNADATTPVGSATIVPSLGNLASAHYAFAFANGTLGITKYALTVTADAKSRVYGAANPVLTATISGFLNGQTLGTSGVSGQPAVTTAAIATTPAGSAIITAASGTLAAANYSFNFVPGTLTITKAVLTVTADAKTRTYGASDPAFAATVTGYVNGETLAVVRGSASFTTNATATSPIGQYVITPALGTLAADNYSFTFAPGALTISPATLTLSVNAVTKVYGDDNPVLTARYLGFLNGETATVVSGAPVLSTTAVKTSPAGNYPITVTAGTLAAANYVFNTTSVLSSNILTVTKAPLTARVTDQSRAYGAANAMPVVTYAGFVLGESASVLTGAPAATHTATAASPVGSYAITLGAGTLATPNYEFTLVPGTLTVNQASLTVTADAKSKVYGAANPALTATISGFANGENLASSGVTGAVAISTTATASSDVGSYPITPSLGTLAAPNYRFGTFTDGALTVTAAGLTVALDSLSQTYDGQPKSVTVTTTPSGIATTVLYGSSATPPTDAGSYAVSATAANANYAGSAQGTLVIAQAAQTIAFPAPATVNVNLPVTLSATASSGLPVTFAVVSGHASVNGSQLTVTDNGTVVVRATQAGSDNYLSATQDLTLSDATLATQTITFEQPAAHMTTDTPFALVATASSGLPVTFTYVSGPATVSNGTVTLNNTAGTVVVRASQAGNASYAAADDVTRSITITAKGVQVFFGGFGSQGAKDVSASAIAVGGGLAANLAPDGEDSTLIGYLPTSGDGFVLKFRLAADGTFSATTTSIPNPTVTPVEARGPATRSTASTALAAITLTFHGQVSGGILSGTIDELSLPFSAEIQPDTGSTAALAGFYQAAPLNSASGNIYSVVSADGGAFVLAITPSYVGGGTGTVDSGGTFTVSTPESGVVAGSVDAVSTSVTGTLTLPSQPAQTFAGLGTGTSRTDRLVNLSSRARITPNSGDSTLITGFVIGGTDPKQVLLRGVGPALAGYGVQNPAATPQLRVFDGMGQLIAQNSGWNNDSTLAALAANLGATPFATGSKDAAVALTLAPGTYTMHVFTTGAAGVALAEIYDADTTPAYQRLLNISTRGPVSSGEGVLIAGFVVTGNSPKRVLIRGAGPGLAQHGVSGVLADPVVRLYDRTGAVIALNDNWETPVTVGSTQTAATAADISSANTQVGAFDFASGSKDAALIVVLAPGIYSAQVGSANNGTGNALVEVYEIP